MHMFGVGDLWVEQAEVRADPIPPPAAMADGDGKASKRRRSLSLKERQLHAPMSDFDGIAYDEDAAYIHVPDRSVRFSQTSKSSPDDDEDGDDDSVASDEEGVRMVRKLQRTSRSLAEQSSAWGLRLWRESEAVRAPAESPGDADDRFRRPLEGTEAGVSVEVEDIGERRIRQARREHASRVAPAPSLQRVLYDDDASDDSGMEEEEKRTARVQPWGVAAGRDDVAGAGQPSEDDDAPGGLFRVRRAPVVDSLANAWSRDCSTVAAPITGSAAEDAQLRQRFAARAAFVEHYKGGTSDADEVVDVEARPPVPSDPTVNDGSDEDGDDEAWDDLSDAVEEESGESDAENDSSSAVMGGTDAEQVFDVDGGNDGDDSGSGDRDEEVEMTDGESNNHICEGARFVDAADRNQVRLETADGGASTQPSTSEANAVTALRGAAVCPRCAAATGVGGHTARHLCAAGVARRARRIHPALRSATSGGAGRVARPAGADALVHACAPAAASLVPQSAEEPRPADLFGRLAPFRGGAGPGHARCQRARAHDQVHSGAFALRRGGVRPAGIARHRRRVLPDIGRRAAAQFPGGGHRRSEGGGCAVSDCEEAQAGRRADAHLQEHGVCSGHVQLRAGGGQVCRRVAAHAQRASRYGQEGPPAEKRHRVSAGVGAGAAAALLRDHRQPVVARGERHLPGDAHGAGNSPGGAAAHPTPRRLDVSQRGARTAPIPPAAASGQADGGAALLRQTER
eukprot:ctg_299.g164